jgi:hypothetical protein
MKKMALLQQVSEYPSLACGDSHTRATDRMENGQISLHPCPSCSTPGDSRERCGLQIDFNEGKYVTLVMQNADAPVHFRWNRNGFPFLHINAFFFARTDFEAALNPSAMAWSSLKL